MNLERPRVSSPSVRATTAGPGAYTHARVLSGFSSTATGSVPIRAPLTIDDDDQEDEDDSSDFESGSRKSASNDGSNQSSVTDFGTDDGLESASADTDEETAEKDAVLSRIRVYRPIGEDPGGETGEGSGFNVRSRVYSLPVGDKDEETSVNYSSFGEEDGESGSDADRVGTKARIVIPRVRLSLDDDEVDQVWGSEDEDGYAGVFEGPSTRTAARVKCSSIAGEEDMKDKSSEVGESNVVDRPEFKGSVISGEEETMEMNYSDTGSVPLETVEEKAIQWNSFKDTVHVTDSSSHELDALLISDEVSVVLGSGDLGGEDMVNMIGEAENFQGNDCCIVSELGKPECKIEQGRVLWDSETFCMNRIVKPESESARKIDLEGTVRNLVLLNKDISGSGFRNRVEMADGIVENEEQILLEINNQFVVETDLQADQISVKGEESLLLSDKGEIIASGSSITTVEKAENEEQMARLIHEHTFTEFDEYEVTSDRREELSDNASQCSSKESSSKHFMGHLNEEEKERIQKIQLIRAKLMRLFRKLGLSADDSIASEVLAKLVLASGKHRTVHGFYAESDKMEIMNSDDVDFSVNILVLGKSGVGKSATINSIFGEPKSPVGAFGLTTKSTRDIIGDIGGIGIRILDTPGLRSSASEERFNRKILLSIKKRLIKFPVDIVLYIDRLDEHSGEISDIQLLRSITGSLGSSIWKNAIVVLTHAASIFPDSSYNDFVAQRSFLLLQWIRQAVPESDLSMLPKVVLAENNENSFPKNESEECLLVKWRQQLLLLCLSAKTMSEASSLQRPGNMKQKSKLLDFPLHSFSLFHSLWNLLLYQAHPVLFSQSCNELEPNKVSLSDSRSEKLCEENKAYFDELRFLEKKEQAEAKRIAGDRAKNSVFGERRNLGIRANTGKEGFFVCFDTLDVKTGITIGGASRAFVSVRNNNGQQGQMLLRMRCLEQMQIAAFGVLPLLISLYRRVCCENTQKNSK